MFLFRDLWLTGIAGDDDVLRPIDVLHIDRTDVGSGLVEELFRFRVDSEVLEPSVPAEVKHQPRHMSLGEGASLAGVAFQFDLCRPGSHQRALRLRNTGARARKSREKLPVPATRTFQYRALPYRYFFKVLSMSCWTWPAATGARV